jgi:predicted neutral ceramidase superfamily lipid hydrolase
MDTSIHPLIQHAVFLNVPLDTIRLLLILPIAVTLIAFFRQVVGFKAFGIYTPSLITFAFLIVGLKYGIAVYISVIVVGILSRYVLKHVRILYLPRVAITLTIISFVMLAILYFGASFQRTGFANVSIVPLIIMIVLVEKFVATQIEKGTKTALLTAVQTFIISLVTFYIVGWEALNTLVLAYPWAILFIIPLNILLGKWTGLRLSEYYRFQSILKKH